VKKTSITSIIAAAFSFVVLEAAQAQEQEKVEDWESGLVAEEAEADLIKVQAGECRGHCGGNNEEMGPEGEEYSFPEGSTGRIIGPEENQ
jgi:hypothetical protein